MAIKTKEQLKALLETGDILSQATFEDLIDSLPSIQDNNEDLYKVKTLTSNTPNGNDIGEEGVLGQSPDGNIWFKKSGIDNNGWEKIFISTDEDFEANIGLSDVSDIVPDLNVLGLKGNNLVLGDGVTVGGNRTINSSELDPFTYFVASDGSVDMKNIIGELASSDKPVGSALVQIGNSVTTIGSYAFDYWSSNNQPLVIPDSVTEIGVGAFNGWQANNQPLVIGNSVTSIGDYAFKNWYANEQPLVIPDSVTEIGSTAFGYWSVNNQPLVIGNSVTSIGNYAFSSWYDNEHPLVIPDSVTEIGNFAFFNWSSNNQPLVIPDSVTEIGSVAFEGWAVNNQPLVIPDSVTSIGNYAFYGWYDNNQPLVIPDSVTEIGSTAFSSWYDNNQPLVIGDSVTSIGNYAFGLWTSMTEPIYCGFNFSAFTGIGALQGNGVTQIYVKPGATGWTADDTVQTIQGKSGITVSNWNNYPNPIPN
jgi:hypothetical protein